MHRLDRRKFLTTSAALAGATLAGGLGSRLARAGQPAADWSKLVAGNTQFGMELYGELKGEAGNLFLSPFSISTALGMTAAGARGKTLEEMETVLHLPGDPHAGFGAIIKSLNEEPDAKKRGFTLSTANALWAQQGYPWKPEYKKLVATDYGAGLFDVNFKGDAEASRTTINQWVEKETRDKIKDLLPVGSVTPDTRLVLTNAIYFKGDWQDPFDKKATRDLPFTTTGGKTVEAPLMFRVGRYLYGENDAFQVIDMPYTGRRISMTVILPRKADGLPAVEKELTAAKLAETVKGLRLEREVHVHLPRFKVTKDFLLNKPLKALGMKLAFEKADFSGMHTGGEQLDITAVLHKAFVDVNEEGTEAAAATGVVVGVTSAAPPPTPKYFKADHPFLFLIRDQKTGSVLFMGRLENPRG
jgi:serpin B